MFKEEGDQSQFEWNMLGDLKEGRPNLGPFDQSGNGYLIHFTSVPQRLATKTESP
jgi:uncharacterized protein